MHAESLQDDGYRDRLTGLLNHAGLERKLRDLKAKIPGDFSLLMVDIDGLKAINDQHGHAAGNQLLVRAGSVMTQSVRTELKNVEEDHRTDEDRDLDAVAVRIHGDEFAIVLPKVNSLEALVIIRDRIERNLQAAGISASVDGRVHGAGEPIETLLDDADLLMLWRKKRRGTDRFNALPRHKRLAALVGAKLLQYAGVNPPRQ
ncbi:GGDEF domain-containing protein [Candidatus Saccharibacteria bacterium]|nr:GGDEF domain-containing protein [Candidatus Saccharibacteria bacterium]